MPDGNFSQGSQYPRLVVISGPTGVGKTGLSLKLAARYGAHVVNADSLQVYRYMDIGTAKPTPEEQAAAVHHLLDVVDPDENFDAAAYLGLARPLIDDLVRQGIPILVVGGTGLYLRSLVQGLFEGPGRDPAVRSRLEAEAKEHGREALHARLEKADPTTAARLHPRDKVRVVRALEVYELTGRPISEFQAQHRLGDKPYEVLFVCLNLPRQELYARIEARTLQMFDLGLLEEVESLLARGYSPDLKPLRSIGYKEAVRHLQGRFSLEETIREIMKQTRRFAKRQLTWFRAQPEVHWVSPLATDHVEKEVGRFWGQPADPVI